MIRTLGLSERKGEVCCLLTGVLSVKHGRIAHHKFARINTPPIGTNMNFVRRQRRGSKSPTVLDCQQLKDLVYTTSSSLVLLAPDPLVSIAFLHATTNVSLLVNLHGRHSMLQ